MTTLIVPAARRTLLGATLAASLLVTSVALAGPRQAPKAPAPQVLTPWERLCQHMGRFAYNRALDRDNGWALLDVVQRSRVYDRTHGAPPLIEAAHDDITRGVWQFPALTPTALRQITELACLQDPPTRILPRGTWR